MKDGETGHSGDQSYRMSFSSEVTEILVTPCMDRHDRGPPVSLVKSGGQQSGMPCLRWALGRVVSTCVSRISPSFQCSAFTVTIGKSAFRALGSTLHLGAPGWQGIPVEWNSPN